jgi:cellulose biosynthesis protein BcsQ
MRSITVFNNKGGVGKTTLLCNLASYFAIRLRKKVLIVDADPQCNATTYLFDEHSLLDIELGQLVELPDRQAFWTLFNESVSPLTSYRIESHTLQMQPNLFKA